MKDERAIREEVERRRERRARQAKRKRRRKLRTAWRPRPPTVCPRCEGMQKRKTAIKEAVDAHYWGEVDPFLCLGDQMIYHFLCPNCGNVSAYQLYFEVPW